MISPRHPFRAGCNGYHCATRKSNARNEMRFFDDFRFTTCATRKFDRSNDIRPFRGFFVDRSLCAARRVYEEPCRVALYTGSRRQPPESARTLFETIEVLPFKECEPAALRAGKSQVRPGRHLVRASVCGRDPGTVRARRSGGSNCRSGRSLRRSRRRCDRRRSRC
jgi:hypothetical protein